MTPQLINLPKISDLRGNLTFIEQMKQNIRKHDIL